MTSRKTPAAGAEIQSFAIGRDDNAVAVVQRGSETTATPAIHVELKATLSGHTGKILAIAFSPDGEIVATSCEDCTVRLWNARTGQLQATLVSAGKRDCGMNISWSPDGQAVAIDGGYDGAGTQIWDVRTARIKAVLATRRVKTVTWSPDSTMLLTTRYWDHFVELWDAETGSLRATLDQDPPCPKKGFWKDWYNNRKGDPNCQESLLMSARFGADGTVITGSEVNPAKLWDARTTKLKTIMPLRGDEYGERWSMSDIVLSPDRRLVARYLNKEVALLDTSNGEVKYVLGGIGLPMAFSPDSKMLLTTMPGTNNRSRGDRDEIRLYDVATGRLQLTFEKSFLTDRSDLLWGSNSHTILIGNGGAQLLDPRTGKVKGFISYEACVSDRIFGDGNCQPFILSADGRLATKVTNPIRLWSGDNATQLTILEAAHAPAQFSPTDPRLLVTRSKDPKTALLWEVTVN